MIDVAGLTVRFGGTTAIDDLTACLDAPICGLIGPNGAGKTTLLNVISGFVTPSAGRIAVNDTALDGLGPVQRVRLGIRRSFQTEQVVDDLDVRDNVRALLDHLPPFGRSAAEEIERVLAYVGLIDVATRLGASLDLYQRRMVELAKALAGAPRLLLLDEPGAGLNEIESGRLRELILGAPEFCGGQVLLIDHDVDLISATCAQTLVLDFGKRLALGETRSVMTDPAVRIAYLGAEEVDA